MRGRGPSGEQGSATVWVLALSGVVAVVGVAAVLVGVAVGARHRATAAASLPWPRRPRQCRAWPTGARGPPRSPRRTVRADRLHDRAGRRRAGGGPACRSC